MSPGTSLLSDGQPQNALVTGTKTIVEKLGRSVLDFLLPLRCPGCGKTGTWFCEECRAKLRLVENFTCVICGKSAIGGFTHPTCRQKYSLDRLLCVFQYEGPIKKAIAWLKYKDVTGLARVLSDLMVEELQKLGVEFGSQAIIIPVPLHWKRAWKRGFNQAELLARCLGQAFGLEVRTDLLRRIRDTEPQTRRKRDQRRRNVSGAFAVPSSKRKEVEGQDFLLVDDVCTTGATLNACANALKRAGARYVWGLTLARD